MKSLFNFIQRVAEIAIIFTVVFVVPAAVALLVTWNMEVYTSMIGHPLYVAVMFFISITAVGAYVDNRISD